jgi:hypothetical protein
MIMDYLKRYCVQTMEANEDMADRNQNGLTGWRKTQGNCVVETGGRMSRIEVTGDLCFRRPGPSQGCKADDDDDEKSLKITPRLDTGHTWDTKPTKYLANYWVPQITCSVF